MVVRPILTELRLMFLSLFFFLPVLTDGIVDFLQVGTASLLLKVTLATVEPQLQVE